MPRKMTNDIYLIYNIMLMKTAGALSFGSENRIKICLVWFWRFVQNMVLLYFTIAAYIHLRQSTGFVFGVQGIMYLGTGIFYMWRLNYFIIYETELLSLVSDMQTIFKWKTSTGIEEKSLEKQVKYVKKFTIYSTITLTIFSQSTIILPYLLTKTSERTFPMPLWFPNIWKISPFYELAVCYQLYVMQVFVVMTIGIDIFFASTVILMCSQLDMLGWECKCVLRKASNKLQKQLIIEEGKWLKVKMPNNEALNFQRTEIELLNDLGEIVAFHQSLLSFCDRFNDFFSPMILWYMFLVLAIIVFVLAIMMTKEVSFFVSIFCRSIREPSFVAILIFISIFMFKGRDLYHVAMFGPYVLIGGTFVFLPCYFGHLLTTQSEQLFNDLYDAPWYMCNENFNRIFKLLHFRARKPIVLTIGKFGNLSLEVFLACARSVVSYVTVLCQISEQH